MAGLSGQGLVVLRIDRGGHVVWARNAQGRDIQGLTSRAGTPSRAVVWPRWNEAFWGQAVQADGEPRLVSLIAGGSDYHDQTVIGVVLWSSYTPGVLDVCLIPAERLGIEIDPLWQSLLGRGRLFSDGPYPGA